MNLPLLIAELGASHLGSLERAIQIATRAAAAGAKAFKLQCWSKDSMCVSDYTIPSGPWQGRNMRDLYRECYTPWEWFEPIFEVVRSLEMIPFASAFDLPAVEFLEGLDVDLHKVSSFDVVDLELVRRVAQTGKPIILSCGASTMEEIDRALDTIDQVGSRKVTLLHCVSEYPSKPEQANLATMMDMRSRFHCDVGLSDHSQGIGVAIAAACLGAGMIEKHLTLRRSDGGPDAAFSMIPEEFSLMATGILQSRLALGLPTYVESPSSYRKSLWWVRSGEAGQKVERRMIAAARPDLGAECRFLEKILGATLVADVTRGHPVKYGDLSFP
jgi:sialic acid synthase SpsE